jgi:hypothetical protein
MPPSEQTPAAAVDHTAQVSEGSAFNHRAADAMQISVDASSTWRALCIGLAACGLRPLILPEDLDTTISESLRLDEVGDRSHLHGPLLASVQSAQYRDPALGLQTLLAGDPALASRVSQAASAGALEQLTISALSCPQAVWLRRCAWTSVPEFIRDVLIDAAVYQHEFLRARLFFGSKKCVVRALLGSYAAAPDTSLLRPVTATEAEAVDLSTDPSRPKWPRGSWLALRLPLPDGLRAWPELALCLETQGLIHSLARGASSMCVLPQPSEPSAGLSRWQFRVTLRPEVAASEQASLLPRLRQVAERAVALGAWLLPTGTESDSALADLPGNIGPSLRTRS